MQTTHSPLLDDRAVMVGISSLAMPVLSRTSCSQVSEEVLLARVCKNVNLSRLESRVGGILMFFGFVQSMSDRVFYIGKM